MTMCLEWRIKEGELRIVVANVKLLIMCRAACVFGLQFLLNLLASHVVPIPKVYVRTVFVIQGNSCSTYALCAPCRISVMSKTLHCMEVFYLGVVGGGLETHQSKPLRDLSVLAQRFQKSEFPPLS